MSDADNNRRENNMRTVRTKVYKFNELSEDAKQTAIEQLYDINVNDSYWYESTYEDAADIGLRITGFDIDRSNYCKGDFIMSAESVAHAIIENHGKECDTCKTAQEFYNEYNKAFEKYPIKEDEQGYDENEYDRDELIEEIEEEFKSSLLEDYLKILRDEYEYQTSKEAIIETIEANEYEFTKEGNRYY